MTGYVDEFTLRRLRQYAEKFVGIYTAKSPEPDPVAAGEWARENIPEELMQGEPLAALQGFIKESFENVGWSVTEPTVQ